MHIKAKVKYQESSDMSGDFSLPVGVCYDALIGLTMSRDVPGRNFLYIY